MEHTLTILDGVTISAEKALAKINASDYLTDSKKEEMVTKFYSRNSCHWGRYRIYRDCRGLNRRVKESKEIRNKSKKTYISFFN